jgi:hypothetical protein
MIIDHAIVIRESRLLDHSGAFIAHGAVDKHDGLPRPSLADLQLCAVDLHALRNFAGHFLTSVCTKVCGYRIRLGLAVSSDGPHMAT